MILIDASNIKQGGGKVLLSYLENHLTHRGVKFITIKRKDLAESNSFNHGMGLNLGSLFSRRRSILKYIEKFNPVVLFCFGNYPPSKKIKGVRTITFFQNALLLKGNALDKFSLKNKLILLLRRLYLKMNIQNSSEYVFQTKTVKARFIRDYKTPEINCHVLPFFDEEKIIRKKGDFLVKSQSIPKSFIYPSSAHAHKNHKNLFAALLVLLEKNIRPEVFLTIPVRADTEKLLDEVEQLKDSGVRIKNLGALPHEELLEWIFRCEFMIYPSLEETIGLSLVEGAILDTKILVSAFDYHKDIIIASGTFDPQNSSHIAETIESALLNDLPLSSKKLNNQIDDLVDFLEVSN